MVLILDGNPEHVAQLGRKIRLFEINFRFATATDVNKCLKKLKMPISLSTCATISKLPYNMIIMQKGKKSFESGLILIGSGPDPRKFRIQFRPSRKKLVYGSDLIEFFALNIYQKIVKIHF